MVGNGSGKKSMEKEVVLGGLDYDGVLLLLRI